MMMPQAFSLMKLMSQAQISQSVQSKSQRKLEISVHRKLYVHAINTIGPLADQTRWNSTKMVFMEIWHTCVVYVTNVSIVVSAWEGICVRTLAWNHTHVICVKNRSLNCTIWMSIRRSYIKEYGGTSAPFVVGDFLGIRLFKSIWILMAFLCTHVMNVRTHMYAQATWKYIKYVFIMGFVHITVLHVINTSWKIHTSKNTCAYTRLTNRVHVADALDSCHMR